MSDSSKVKVGELKSCSTPYTVPPRIARIWEDGKARAIEIPGRGMSPAIDLLYELTDGGYDGPREPTSHGEAMEKNSVVQVVRPTAHGQKTSATPTCPKCGAKCEQRGQVFACPTHGTEPFEGK